jgi:transcription elongation factor Elf1
MPGVDDTMFNRVLRPFTAHCPECRHTSTIVPKDKQREQLPGAVKCPQCGTKLSMSYCEVSISVTYGKDADRTYDRS